MTATAPSHGVAPRGFRLPAETRPGRVRLQVSDLRRSLAFYQDVLGMHVQSEHAGHAALGPREDTRTLVELSERAGALPVPRRGRLGLYHFALLLPDRPALGRFARHVLPTGRVTGMSDHSGE